MATLFWFPSAAQAPRVIAANSPALHSVLHSAAGPSLILTKRSQAGSVRLRGIKAEGAASVFDRA